MLNNLICFHREELLERLGRGGVSGANIWSKGFPFVDVLRYVGTQEDGGNLYLLKTYIKDPYREDKMATTAAFVIVLNYDEDAEPGAYFGIATEPLASFTKITKLQKNHKKTIFRNK